MAQINTNTISLNAQRNLSFTQNALATSIQRLSSGLRVNSAKDDAAGLSIAERMNAQARGMTVAIRNANDGISLAQTAEGALGKVGDLLQRMRELAVQSSNATNKGDDRDALDKEVQELKAEIGRMAETTAFNGTKLLDGSFLNESFQVGANNDASDRIEIAAIVNAKLDELGDGASARTVYEISSAATPNATKAIGAGDFKINGTAIDALPANAANPGQYARDLADRINDKTSETGVSAKIDEDTGKLLLSSSHAFTVTDAQEALGNGAAAQNATVAVNPNTALDVIDVTTADNARDAIDTIDRAMQSINTARADMGALQSRFEAVIGTLQISVENITAARGRIMDTDFAAETASLSRAQVLQQAGMAMLSQANAVPQNVLTLLR